MNLDFKYRWIVHFQAGWWFSWAFSLWPTENPYKLVIESFAGFLIASGLVFVTSLGISKLKIWLFG